MGCALCCSYPNGLITLAPCLLSVVAFILTSISLYSCRYAQLDGSGVGIGLVYREATHGDDSLYGNGYCTTYIFYDNSLLDGNFKAAYGLGLAAWFVGLAMAIAVWSVSPCVRAARAGWRIMGGLFFMVGFFQLLTLLILASNLCARGCSLQGGGIVGIIAFLVWWIVAGICFMVPEPKPPSAEPNPAVQEMAPVQATAAPAPAMAATETTTQHVEADGTVVIEKVTTHQDGTTTVTSEIIPPASARPIDANFEKR